MTVQTLNGSGSPPDVIRFRYCSTDSGHWRTDGERCPVCRAVIQTVEYVPVAMTEEDADAGR